MFHRGELSVSTRGRGTYDITNDIAGLVRASAAREGLATVFIHHTSASLIICENADPSVRTDLERFAAKLVPDGDPMFEHDAEGPDDMPAHIRAALTQTHLSIPVVEGRMALGAWQGIFLFEHRAGSHRRSVLLHLIGQ